MEEALHTVVNIVKYGFLVVFAAEFIVVARAFMRLMSEKAGIQPNPTPPVQE